MLFYSFEITAMAGKGIVAVYSRFQHSGNYVIGRITVCETIRHNKIKHIAGVESFHFGSIRLSLFEFVRNGSLFFTLFQDNIECLRSCFRCIQIDNEIVRIFLFNYLLQSDVTGRDADFCRRYIFTV